MNYKLFNPKAVAADILDGISLKGKTLAVFTSSFDPSCELYIRSLIKVIMPRGGDIVIRQSDPAHCAKGFISQIEDAAGDSRINGILVLKPLPEGVSEEAVRAVLPPEKDVDGFGLHWLNAKESGAEAEGFFPPCVCTAVMELLKAYEVDARDKRVAIINDMPTLGKPLAFMLTDAGALVTNYSLETGIQEESLLNTDIILSAAGCPGLINKDLIAMNAVIVDIGMNYVAVEDMGGAAELGSSETCKPGMCPRKYQIVGDTTDDCAEKASLLSSVNYKNGIGSITTAVLARNLAKTR